MPDLAPSEDAPTTTELLTAALIVERRRSTRYRAAWLGYRNVWVD